MISRGARYTVTLALIVVGKEAWEGEDRGGPGSKPTVALGYPRIGYRLDPIRVRVHPRRRL